MEAYSILEGLIRNRRAVEISPTAAKRPAERPAAAVEDYDAVKWNRAPNCSFERAIGSRCDPKKQIPKLWTRTDA